MSEHFDRFVARSPGCHLWIGGKDKDGYGLYRPPRSSCKVRATRFAFQRTYGFLPAMVCHECDTPSCVNPAHLFAGDAASNAADMVAKGRRAPARNGRKLSDAQVREIRANPAHLSMAVLALQYGVSKGCIQQVIERRTYRAA